MLSWFRKHAGSPWAKALYIFIAVTFFGGFGMLSSGRFRSCIGGDVQEDDVVAVVGGKEDITYGMLVRSIYRFRENWLRMMSEQYGDDIPQDILEGVDFKSQVMDMLVEDIVLHSAAEEWGIDVTDAEVRYSIGKTFRDRSGRFSRDIYEASLRNAGISEAVFEQRARDNIFNQKIMALVASSAKLLEGEARERYIFEQEKINLDYLSFDIDERFKDEKPTEEEINEYFEENSDRFNLPETRKIRFFRFHVPDYEGKVKLTNEKIEEFYEQSRDRYLVSPEKAVIRHILIRTPDPPDEERINASRALSEDLVARAREGMDFGELARTYSEDLNTKQQGGFTGEVVRGAMPPLDDAIFSLEPGEISDPVLTMAGFYIIKMEEKIPSEYESLEDVKDEVKGNLRRSTAFAMATIDANTVVREIDAGKDMERISGELGFKLYASEFFHRDERNVPDIPDIYLVAGEAFYLDKGQVSGVISGLDDVYVIEVVEIISPHQASLEESRTKIERIIGPEVKKKRALDEARGYLDELKAGASLNSVARKAGLEWEEAGLFPRAAADVPGVGYSEDIKVAAFRLGPDQPWPDDVYEVSRKMVILHFREKQEADLDEFDENPEDFEQEMLYEKQMEIFERFKEVLKKDAVKYEPLYEEIK